MHPLQLPTHGSRIFLLETPVPVAQASYLCTSTPPSPISPERRPPACSLGSTSILPVHPCTVRTHPSWPGFPPKLLGHKPRIRQTLRNGKTLEWSGPLPTAQLAPVPFFRSRLRPCARPQRLPALRCTPWSPKKALRSRLFSIPGPLVFVRPPSLAAFEQSKHRLIESQPTRPGLVLGFTTRLPFGPVRRPHFEQPCAALNYSLEETRSMTGPLTPSRLPITPRWPNLPGARPTPSTAGWLRRQTPSGSGNVFPLCAIKDHGRKLSSVSALGCIMASRASGVRI